MFFKRRAKPVAPPPAPDASFEDILEAETQPDPAPLAEAYAFVREHLPQADNLGRTGDERDYYTHLDKLSEGVSKTFPESFCRSGCSACCHYPVGLFTISRTEWNVIRRHIETEWSEADRQDFIARFNARFSWWWLFVLGHLQNSLMTLLVTANWVQKQKIACPFLKDDRCSVYAARPYQCRTFGHFSARQWPFKQPKIYACSEQGDNLLQLLDRKGPQFQLPVMNPIVRQIRRLCQGPRQSLPMWVAGWVRRQRDGEKA